MVNKVWAYIVRQGTGEIELLVFDHASADAGTQIPAGTVELGEDVRVAIAREVFEETGVRVESFTQLEIFERVWEGHAVRVSLFGAWTQPSVCEDWVHHVTGKGDDAGMVFHCFWLPRAEWHRLWGDFKLGFPALDQFIKDRQTTERA